MNNKREGLKYILKRLHEAKPEELDKVKKEAAKHFKEVEPHELALAEQELIHEGVGREEMKRLCDVHLEVMKEKLGAEAKKIKLESWHPIQISMDEHKIIKRNLKKLKKTIERLKRLDSYKKARTQINTLKELGHFFLDTEKHHKREEEALFPSLEAHGITEPPQIFKEDHKEFLARKKQLYDAAMETEDREFKDFVKEVSGIGEFLVKNLEDHIYKEDNILYPMSLQVLEQKEWKDVRKKFDAIGYCCFAPADLQN